VTTHGPHPDVHYAGLQASCMRCQELVRHPEQLDDEIQTRLRRWIFYTELDWKAFRNLIAEGGIAGDDRQTM